MLAYQSPPPLYFNKAIFNAGAGGVNEHKLRSNKTGISFRIIFQNYEIAIVNIKLFINIGYNSNVILFQELSIIKFIV